jgi:foldase protein PrsA
VTKRIVVVVSVLMLFGLFALVAGCGGSELPDNAVAQVGDVYITQEQLDARVADFKAQYAGSIPDEATDPDGYKDFTRDVLDYLITYEVVTQKAEELAITVTDEEVQTEIDSILEQSFGGDQAQFDEALKAQNMTMEQLKVNYKESMLLQKAYEEVTKDVTTVPDADIAAYYEENKADYFVDETRTARHILISPTAEEDSSTTSTTVAGDTTTTTAAPTEADWADALSEAEKVRQELADGGDWTALAAEYSDDPGSKDAGGDLGVVSKGQMVPEFDEAVFSLAKDEISQPIKTSYGYHIIQVTDITEAKQSTLDEVKEDISSTLVNEKKGQVWQDWLDSIRTKLGVVFKAGMEPTTTTTAATTETTTSGGATTTNTPATTAGEATTTTQAGSTITTAAP